MPRYFAPPVMAMVLILNDGTIITIAYDYGEADKVPEKWTLPVVCSTESSLYQFRYHVKHQPSRAHGLQLFQSFCNVKNQPYTLYRRRLEWRTLRVLTEWRL